MLECVKFIGLLRDRQKQSSGLIIHWSKVLVLPGPPFLLATSYTSRPILLATGVSIERVRRKYGGIPVLTLLLVTAPVPSGHTAQSF